MSLPNELLLTIFEPTATVTNVEGKIASFHSFEAGHLVLPTGKITVSDPMLNPWVQPFNTRVRPGKYPVFISVTHNDVAAVLVQFHVQTPIIWRKADPATFSVDSASGAIMDAKVNRFLRRKADADKYDRYAISFRNALEEADGKYAECCIDAERERTCSFFTHSAATGHFRSSLDSIGEIGLFAWSWIVFSTNSQPRATKKMRSKTWHCTSTRFSFR